MPEFKVSAVDETTVRCNHILSPQEARVREVISCRLRPQNIEIQPCLSTRSVHETDPPLFGDRLR